MPAYTDAFVHFEYPNGFRVKATPESRQYYLRRSRQCSLSITVVSIETARDQENHFKRPPRLPDRTFEFVSDFSFAGRRGPARVATIRGARGGTLFMTEMLVYMARVALLINTSQWNEADLTVFELPVRSFELLA